MILRPRQTLVVERSLAALQAHGNTLAVGSTGMGKTIVLSAVIGATLASSGVKACVLAHRDELTAQNRAKFLRVNPGASTSVVDASSKSWSGQTTFAMVQTLSREANVHAIPALDLLVIDEAHHATATSYRRIIDVAYAKNPKMQLFGVTATPQRCDGVGLRAVFSNVADQVRLGELIASGHLVPPRTFVVDVGTQDALAQVKKTSLDFDMSAVESIMNTVPINARVIEQWRRHAADRQTIIFCSTVAHAEDVGRAFSEAGIANVVVHGELSETERKSRLFAYETNQAQVVVNVAVLTEGYDHTPTSCIVLLRPSSHKSTLIQMVGRGLRTVDLSEFPNVCKSDCVVLDFGTASIMHGRLEQDVDLDGEDPRDAPKKVCPKCGGHVPLRTQECPLCLHVFEVIARIQKPLMTGDFVMTEIDLLSKSNFSWVDLFGQDDTLIATGFESWAGLFAADGCWYAIGGAPKERPRVLARGERLIALAAADDWLNGHESASAAFKSKRWLKEAPSEKQLSLLPETIRGDFGLTRYQASAHLSFQFNRAAIQSLVWTAHDQHLQRAA
jgi:DNA repair protein RadD